MLMKKTILLLALFLMALPGFADTSKLAGDLLGLLSNPLGSVDVIVQYKSAPTFLDLAQLTALGGTVTGQYSLIPAVKVTLPSAAVVLVSDLLNVAYMSPNRQLLATLDYSAAAVNAAAELQYGLDGTGVGIAIIDSGIY